MQIAPIVFADVHVAVRSTKVIPYKECSVLGGYYHS